MRFSSSAPAVVVTALVSLSPSSSAQVKPGQYIATVKPAGNSELWIIDAATRTPKRVVVPAALAAEWMNCITMRNFVLGYIGTNATTGGNVWQITLSPTGATAKKLNSNALAGGNVSQVVVRGNTLFFAAGNGAVYSMPIGGGTATLLVDVTTLTGFPTGGVQNALATDGRALFVPIWPGGQVYRYDFATKKTALFTTLPGSKRSTTGSLTFNPVHAQVVGISLVVASLYGDIAIVNVLTKATVQIYKNRPVATGTPSRLDYNNSLAFNSDTGDWVCGTRDGGLDLYVVVGNQGHKAGHFVEKIGSSPPAAGSPSVNGLAYIAGGGSYKAFGLGCADPASNTIPDFRLFPTSTGLGPLAKGATFAAGLESPLGKGVGVLRIGVLNRSPYPIDLSAVGAPTCFVRANAIFSLPAILKSTVPGYGHATITFAIPPTLSFTGHTQWIAVGSPSTGNTLGLLFSDARTAVIR